MMNQSMFLGRWYKDGQIVCRQGELGDCMYVVQEGQIELMRRDGSREYCLGIVETGSIWGEAALLERDHLRTATARAIGDACVLTIEKQMFLNRMNEDPSFALQILKKLSRRVLELETALVRSAPAAAAVDLSQITGAKPAGADK
jgi:CRP-like cAMP-binding protein